MTWPGMTVMADCVKSVLNIILHQCIAVVLIYSIWGPAMIGGQASWHAVLCTLGVFPFMSEALILFGGDNVWTTELEREAKIWLHLLMMLLGVTCLLAGISMEIERQARISGKHFSTTHGILGLVILILIFISVVIGLLARFSKTFKGYTKPVVILFVHNILGILTYVFAIAALCSGYHTPIFIASETSKNAAIVLSIFICLWSLIHSLTSLYKQIRLIL